MLCQSGGRARKAIEKLERAGVHGCVLVEGGTQGWMDAGLPVDRGQSKVLPLMRQVQITVGFISAVGAVLALAVNPLFAIIPLAHWLRSAVCRDHGHMRNGAAAGENAVESRPKLRFVLCDKSGV